MAATWHRRARTSTRANIAAREHSSYPSVSSQALILALAAPAAGFSFGNTKTSAQTYVSPFKDMPGAYGWASEKGLAYSFGKPFSQQKFPDLVQWVQEVCCPRLVLSRHFRPRSSIAATRPIRTQAEIKHARVAMLAALGYPVAEVFHPLWGGSINEPSLIAFQATPLQTFWPIVVGAIGLIESASYIPVWKSNVPRVRSESPRRPPRHRRDTCSMAWRCKFLTARRSAATSSPRNDFVRIIGAPDALVDFHTGTSAT